MIKIKAAGPAPMRPVRGAQRRQIVAGTVSAVSGRALQAAAGVINAYLDRRGGGNEPGVVRGLGGERVTADSDSVPGDGVRTIGGDADQVRAREKLDLRYCAPSGSAASAEMVKEAGAIWVAPSKGSVIVTVGGAGGSSSVSQAALRSIAAAGVPRGHNETNGENWPAELA